MENKDEMIKVILKATKRYSKRKIDPKGKGSNIKRLEEGRKVSENKLKEMYFHVLNLDSTNQKLDSRTGNCSNDLDSNLDKGLDSSLSSTRSRDNEVEKPTTSLLPQIEEQNKIIESLTRRFTILEQENATLKQENERLQERIKNLEQAYQHLDKKMDSTIQEGNYMDNTIHDTIQRDDKVSKSKSQDHLYGFCLVQRKPYPDGKQYWYAGRMFGGKQKWVYVGKDKELASTKIYKWLQKHQPQELESDN